MLVPTIALAEERSWEEHPRGEMPELSPLFVCEAQYIDHYRHFDAWRASLLLRMDEFDSFTAEEQALVLSYLHAGETTTMSPEEAAEYLRLQYENWLANPYETPEIHRLIRERNATGFRFPKVLS